MPPRNTPEFMTLVAVAVGLGAAMLREMGTTFWLPEAERELARAGRLIGGWAAGATEGATPPQRHERA